MVMHKVGWLAKIKNENFCARKSRSEVFKQPAAMRCHNFYSLMATLAMAGKRNRQAIAILPPFFMSVYLYVCLIVVDSCDQHIQPAAGWVASFCCICKSLATSGQAVGWLCCCFATLLRQLLNIAAKIHTYTHLYSHIFIVAAW